MKCRGWLVTGPSGGDGGMGRCIVLEFSHCLSWFLGAWNPLKRNFWDEDRQVATILAEYFLSFRRSPQNILCPGNFSKDRGPHLTMRSVILSEQEPVTGLWLRWPVCRCGLFAPDGWARNSQLGSSVLLSLYVGFLSCFILLTWEWLSLVPEMST